MTHAVLRVYGFWLVYVPFAGVVCGIDGAS